MSDAEPFGLLILVVAAVGLLAILSNRVSERVRIPAPLFFLAGAAIVAHVYGAGTPSTPEQSSAWSRSP